MYLSVTCNRRRIHRGVGGGVRTPPVFEQRGSGGGPDLQLWLDRHNSYTSENMQNEFLLLISKAVQRKLVADITAVEPVQFLLLLMAPERSAC